MLLKQNKHDVDYFPHMNQWMTATSVLYHDLQYVNCIWCNIIRQSFANRLHESLMDHTVGGKKMYPMCEIESQTCNQWLLKSSFKL